jgi:membrane-bound lytic murein transglycosylase B
MTRGRMRGRGRRRGRRSVRTHRGGRLALVGAAGVGALGLAVLVVSVLGAFGVLSGVGAEAAGGASRSADVPAPSADADGRMAVDQKEPGATAGLGAGGAEGIAGLAEQAWVARVGGRTGIPERALRAYAGAALRLQVERPACGLGWNTLAGIGYVESRHGTLTGGAIDADGVARPAIVGVALDGDGVADIADTDGGALDGDTEHDRAVGPMQFIPATWRTHGVDGSGDGAADPQNVDDAALTAAEYLCDVGGDLSDAAGWIRAIDGYNRGVDYNNAVAIAANRYARAG